MRDAHTPQRPRSVSGCKDPIVLPLTLTDTEARNIATPYHSGPTALSARNAQPAKCQKDQTRRGLPARAARIALAIERATEDGRRKPIQLRRTAMTETVHRFAVFCSRQGQKQVKPIHAQLSGAPKSRPYCAPNDFPVTYALPSETGDSAPAFRVQVKAKRQQAPDNSRGARIARIPQRMPQFKSVTEQAAANPDLEAGCRSARFLAAAIRIAERPDKAGLPPVQNGLQSAEPDR